MSDQGSRRDEAGLSYPDHAGLAGGLPEREAVKQKRQQEQEGKQ